MAADRDTGIVVEVAFALPDKQYLVEITVPAGCTALEAVRRSGVLDQGLGPGRIDALELGIFGQPVAHDQPLLSGDRGEIYRPLLLDPKSRRRQRAASRGGGGSRP